MKKILHFFLIIVLFLLLPFALTACGEAKALLFNIIDDGEAYEVCLKPEVKLNKVKIVIPSTYEDKPVTKIASQGFSENKIMSVEIPNTIIEIDYYAFYNCTNLESIVFKEGSKLTTIGEGAFTGCSNIKTITFPSSVTHIGRWAFSSCVNLESAIFTSDSSLQDFSDDIFSDCTNLKEIELPVNLKTIGDNAFASCISLKNIEIPLGVTSIGRWAFDSCESLESIEIPASVIDINRAAFSRCDKLENVTFANNSQLGVISEDMFYYSSNLKNIEIPLGVTGIDSNAFQGCTSLNNVVIPSSVIYIGSNAFAGCLNISSITIPKSIEKIYSNAFGYWTSSQKIYVIGQISQEQADITFWNSDWGLKGNWRENCNAKIIYN